MARAISAVDGTCYLGQFKDGEKNGKGIMFKYDGTIIAEGIWNNGTLARDQEVDLMNS